MYLKALELQGFKSFPDKTFIPFEKGISAVVGPNGSGKSNLSDAILWVMGEQSSRALRGGKMEDVIFGGTETRKAVGFAQVTLILDNSDGALPLDEREVAVSRRYYRSGESVYSINRTTVRLKDVYELFLDTGLGQEGYSVIGQGKIDGILSAKQEERRGILEEAAGISSFRYRKEEAERKLKRTEENLLRIEDRISELEQQVIPLQEEAKRAEEYLDLREKLQCLEVSLWLKQLEILKGKRKDLLQKLETVSKERDVLQSNVQAWYQETESLRAAMQRQTVSMEEMQKMIHQHSVCQREEESRLAVMEEKATHFLEQEHALRTEQATQEMRLNNLLAQLEEKRSRLRQVEAQQASVQAKQKEVQQQLYQAQNEQKILNDVQATRASQVAARAAQMEWEQERRLALQNVLDELQKQKDQLDREKEKNEKQTIEAEDALHEASKKLKQAQLMLQQATDQLCAAQAQAEQQEEQVGKAQQERTALLRKLDQVKGNVKLLQDLENLYEGYSKAVRVLMTEAKSISGIRGPVSALIQVSPPYAFAIEVALGSALQQIVVETEQVGKEAIAYLKQSQSGRATFLPMNTVHGRPMDVEAISFEKGFLGLASTLVSYHPEYDGIISYLLGRTVVVSDLDCAIAMARNHKHQFRIVTLDGQMLQKGGVMTGGSAGRKAGVLSRAGELKRMKIRQQSLQMQLSGDTSLEEAQNSLNALRAHIQMKEQERNQNMEQVLSLQGEYEQCKASYAALISQKSGGQDMRRMLEMRMEEARSEMASLVQKLEEKTSIQDELVVVLNHEKQTERMLHAQIETWTEQLTEQQKREAALNSERAMLKASLEEQLALFCVMEEDQQKRRTQEKEYEHARQALMEQIEKQKAACCSLRQEQETLQKKLQKLTQERMELEGRQVQREKETQKANQALLKQEREWAALAQKKQEWDIEEKSILEKLWDIYELSHSAALSIQKQLENEEEAAKDVERLKQKMQTLGVPHLGAIEEFERVNERYQYLVKERNDIAQAKEELEGIIGAMTKKMKEIFRLQFDTLNRLFSQVFRSLFGGGKAYLELEADQDILECGIEIRAQPPGKALKTLSLLSGGEKAFVAIALYFAILKLHPTPFCIMDEIEAALDEQNVLRFAQYLRSISDQTQFIVITHRRGTMEEADVLYGVTMQEQGVSKVVTLQLDEVSQVLHFS